MTRIISVMAMVKVTVREGVEIDDDSIMLAADTAARRNEAHSDNMDAVTIWRERRVLGKLGEPPAVPLALQGAREAKPRAEVKALAEGEAR